MSDLWSAEFLLVGRIKENLMKEMTEWSEIGGEHLQAKRMACSAKDKNMGDSLRSMNTLVSLDCEI